MLTALRKRTGGWGAKIPPKIYLSSLSLVDLAWSEVISDDLGCL